jgi:hypothetical protein
MSIRTLAVTITTFLLLPVAAGAVAKVPTTVALSVTTPLSVFYGESIDGMAQVTASDGTTATGSVTFYDGAASFCVLALVNGADCPEGTEKGFAAGTHAFTATYSGDETHAAATSNAVTVIVKQDPTTTALAASAGAVAVGGQVVYTASVAGSHGPVAGMVTFLDGTVAMGSATLSGSGTAALSVLMLVSGDHAITARYEGDGNSMGSVSASAHETVAGSLAATATTLTTDESSAVAGERVTFSAKVTTSRGGAAPSGVVTFSEGNTTLGSGRVQAGVASWSTSALTAGTHRIVADYGGDNLTATSVSAPLTVVVSSQQSSGGVALGTTTATVAAGDTVSIPVTVSGSAGMAKAASLSCSGLPEEASCLYVASASGGAASGGTATLRISTSAPRDCGSSTPYGVPAKGELLPLGLLVMVAGRRRRVLKGLLSAVFAMALMGGMTGCGTGNCTDLGTRPGTYTITVTGSVGGVQVSQKVKLLVTP